MNKLDESLLIRLPPFSRLTRPQIRELLDLSLPRRLEQGQAFFDQGAEIERFYLLLDGHVRVVKTTANGDQIIPLYITPGQLFGIGMALGKTHYPATAEAATECLAISWPAASWQRFADKYEGFSSETYKTIGNRLEELHDHIISMATQQVEQRVAGALLRLTNQSGRRTDEGIEIDFPITRQDIAEMTGTTLHTVSRLLSAWEKRGLIISGRRRIVVTQAHQLVLLSDGLA